VPWCYLVIKNIVYISNEKSRSFGRTRRRWEDNIRMDIREIGLKALKRMHLAQNRDQW
jgi:ribosomal protein L28